MRKLSIRSFALITTSLVLLAPAAHAVSPINVVSVSPNVTQRATFTQPIEVNLSRTTTNPADQAMLVHSTQRGGLRNVGSPVVRSGTRLTYTPPATMPYVPGEQVWYTIPTFRIPNPNGYPLVLSKQVRSFWVAVAGTGHGYFTAAAALPVSATAAHLATADVDGDGDLDLLTANGPANTVSVALNDGTGRYTLLPDLPTGPDPQRVVTGDLDNDGDLDLLVLQSGSTISLRFNDGSGTFTASAARPDIISSISWQDLMLGDMDADGDLDVAASNTTNNGIWIYRNDGTGNFSIFQAFGMGNAPQSMVVANIGSTYQLDLLATNASDNTVTVNLNLSTSTNATATVAVGAGPVALVMADINGDGVNDLLTANARAGTTSVRFGVGGNPSMANLFTGTTDLPVGGAALAVNDLDADGDADLVTANAAGTVSVLLNDGQGAFAASPALPGVALGTPVKQLALSDVDGDLDLDLLVTVTSGPNPVRVYLNNAAPLATRAGLAPAQSLFPNPARHAATLTGAAPQAAVTVLDALGRRVCCTQADAAGTAQLVLPAELPAGVYLVCSGLRRHRLVVE